MSTNGDRLQQAMRVMREDLTFVARGLANQAEGQQRLLEEQQRLVEEQQRITMRFDTFLVRF